MFKTIKYNIFVAIVFCYVFVIATVLANDREPVEVTLAGDWRITVTLKGTPVVSATLDVKKTDIITVTAEKYARLPDFKTNNWAGWQKGVALTGVKAAECTVKGALDPASLTVCDNTENTAVTFEKGKDYDADLDWGGVGRLPEGRIKPDQPVFISYKYAQMRIDSAVLSSEGKIIFKRGEPHTVTPHVPVLKKDEKRLVNIFISGRPTALTSDNLFPITETSYPEPARTVPSIAEVRVPKTMKKLQSGEPLKILAWGDSVTTFQRWQKMFVERLQAKFPKAKIELVTEAWGGRNTSSYLAEPPGSVHNYKEKVLDQKPDLIVSEFVNDAGLKPEQVETRYQKLLTDFQSIGAEWIILTPHYTRPDWMGLKSQRDIDEDPRPYVKGLRLFSEKHNVALADASLRYGRLWRQGIPYLTLMENNINHPNVFGHSLFADSLMALFP
ncbi:MAG: SGNH/GDSL hydrolase family protein [Kiritimatiellae bacterium]|nr:SGNH/GDSL hydrolase family protein [Kiritimatiellia bacterium]